MIRLLGAIIAAMVSGFRSPGGLILENLALRQQLSTVMQKRRPRIGLLGVEKDAPTARSVERCPADASTVRARRRVGGLYHRYEWAAAA